jgi:hypothetical protein
LLCFSGPLAIFSRLAGEDDEETPETPAP